MRRFAAIPVASLLLAGNLAWASPAVPAPVGDGLKVGTDSQEAWSVWQARLSYATPTLPLWGQPLAGGPGGLMLAGDRYFGWGRLGDSGGLRATGGLLLGPSALPGHGANDFFWRVGTNGAAESDTTAAVPYLGLGYSAWWARSGLGLSADLGLAAQRPGQAVRFGRVFSGADSLDDMVRAMQLAPMLQVNLSYAF